eukprot:Plantae.Rhodophyta-Hildenbrandia_rubra.ctg2169.p1 GENE.Plantae.Rhodophyta-Hildenbrandia_rubra.ctg2169~~Plantae.Rhodophyta-Hildenbrandia_rubra.ctg2169.p1  ORF type:complete len:838 (-),score=192.74 Plantae.Rhodophyta-Hildenbrandia_rubra.ctg2169:2630-5143(-)
MDPGKGRASILSDVATRKAAAYNTGLRILKQYMSNLAHLSNAASILRALSLDPVPTLPFSLGALGLPLHELPFGLDQREWRAGKRATRGYSRESATVADITSGIQKVKVFEGLARDRDRESDFDDSTQDVDEEPCHEIFIKATIRPSDVDAGEKPSSDAKEVRVDSSQRVESRVEDGNSETTRRELHAPKDSTEGAEKRNGPEAESKSESRKVRVDTPQRSKGSRAGSPAQIVSTTQPRSMVSTGAHIRTTPGPSDSEVQSTTNKEKSEEKSKELNKSPSNAENTAILALTGMSKVAYEKREAFAIAALTAMQESVPKNTSTKERKPDKENAKKENAEKGKADVSGQKQDSASKPSLIRVLRKDLVSDTEVKNAPSKSGIRTAESEKANTTTRSSRSKGTTRTRNRASVRTKQASETGAEVGKEKETVQEKKKSKRPRAKDKDRKAQEEKNVQALKQIKNKKLTKPTVDEEMLTVSNDGDAPQKIEKRRSSSRKSTESTEKKSVIPEKTILSGESSGSDEENIRNKESDEGTKIEFNHPVNEDAAKRKVRKTIPKEKNGKRKAVRQARRVSGRFRKATMEDVDSDSTASPKRTRSKKDATNKGKLSRERAYIQPLSARRLSTSRRRRGSDVAELSVASGDKWMIECYRIWEKIYEHSYAKFFREPVTTEEAPDYFEIISKPMDLGTIEEHLKIGVLRTPHEFVKAMYLVCNNSMSYNPKGSDLFAVAKDLKQIIKAEATPLLREYRKAMKDGGNSTKADEKHSSTASLSRDGTEATPARRKRGKPQRSEATEAVEEHDEAKESTKRKRKSSGIAVKRAASSEGTRTPKRRRSLRHRG